MQLIGLLGGTFNPIHFGHLRMAQELLISLQLDEVRFIPSANPPHKTAPAVSAAHRAEMVNIAISDNPKFTCDERELKRTGLSYTIDTLISMREELGDDAALCLIMGSDAFMSLNTWHRWQALLNVCHIILVQRPTAAAKPPKLPDELAILLQDHYTENGADLALTNAGCIIMQGISAQEISSTAIRQKLKLHQQPRYMMPDTVLNYIEQHQLYQ